MTQKIYLTRPEAAKYLNSMGIPITKASLQKFATVGGGPIYRIFGNKAVYAPGDLDAWSASKIQPARRSTSDIPCNDLPPKPDYVVEAGNKLMVARKDREAAEGRLIGARHSKPPTIRFDMSRLEDELKKAEADVDAAKEALREARGKWAPDWALSVAHIVDRASGELLDALGSLEAANTVLTRIHLESIHHGDLPVSGLVPKTRTIALRIDELKRVVK